MIVWLCPVARCGASPAPLGQATGQRASVVLQSSADGAIQRAAAIRSNYELITVQYGVQLWEGKDNVRSICTTLLHPPLFNVARIAFNEKF